ncbi:DUF397 domain-containing protein [Streptomyces sp. NPDC056358]|uniref:DUF397 domain-containing protein n=1 Tax=Streptomyces sp. NPDC056358 TaxID=3345794 RepID=UPI0035DF7DC1
MSPPLAHSGGSGTECVEVADLQSTVGVRDSKQPRGPRIVVRHNAWARFVALSADPVGQPRSRVAAAVNER